MNHSSGGVLIRTFSHVLLLLWLGIYILSSTSLADVTEEMDRFCSQRNNGMFSHPWDCGRFVKCYAGLTYVQRCSPELHFNPKIGVCDHPEKVKCNMPEVKVTEIPITTQREEQSTTPDEKYLNDLDENTAETLHDGPTSSRAPLHDVIQDTQIPLHDVTGQTVQWEATVDGNFTATTVTPDFTSSDITTDFPTSDDMTVSVAAFFGADGDLISQEVSAEEFNRIPETSKNSEKWDDTKYNKWNAINLETNQILNDAYYARRPLAANHNVNYVPYAQALPSSGYKQQYSSNYKDSEPYPRNSQYGTDSSNSYQPNYENDRYNRDQPFINYERQSSYNNGYSDNNRDRDIQNNYESSRPNNYNSNGGIYSSDNTYNNRNIYKNNNNNGYDNTNYDRNSGTNYRQQSDTQDRYNSRNNNDNHDTNTYNQYNNNNNNYNTNSNNDNRDSDTETRTSDRRSSDKNEKENEKDDNNDYDDYYDNNDRNNNNNNNQNNYNNRNNNNQQNNNQQQQQGQNQANNYDYPDYNGQEQQQQQQPHGQQQESDDNNNYNNDNNNRDNNNNNGQHSSDGREPPKFDNFPNEFLPNHLTGPRFGGDAFFGPKVGVPQFDVGKPSKNGLENKNAIHAAGEKKGFYTRQHKTLEEYTNQLNKHMPKLVDPEPINVTDIVSGKDAKKDAIKDSKNTKDKPKPKHTVHTPAIPANNYTLLKLYRFKRDLSDHESDTRLMADRASEVEYEDDENADSTNAVSDTNTGTDTSSGTDTNAGADTLSNINSTETRTKPRRPSSFLRIYSRMFNRKKNEDTDQTKDDNDVTKGADGNTLHFTHYEASQDGEDDLPPVNVTLLNDRMLDNDSMAVRHPPRVYNDYPFYHNHYRHKEREYPYNDLPHVDEYDGKRMLQDLKLGPPPSADLHYHPEQDGYGPHSSNDIFAYMDYAMDEAKHHIERRLHNEARMVHQMSYTVDSVPFRYVAAFLATKPYAKYLSHSGLFMGDFLKLMSNKYDMPVHEIINKYNLNKNRPVLKPMPKSVLPDHPMPIPPDIDYCPYPRIRCDEDYPYRTFDGSCNNLKYPILGRSMTPHRRLLPAHYANDIDRVRVSAADGGPLPGAREVSFNLFLDRNRPNRLNTLMLMIWGQFIDHDFTRTALVEMMKENKRYFGETEELKCGFDGCVTGLPALEECMPIPIPRDDYDFRFNRCIKFVRSAPVPPLSCKPGNREQLNQVTTYLDGSMIYGSTKQEANELRDFFDSHRGKMAVTPHPFSPYLKPLLPQDDVDMCRDTNFTVRCFKAGDERVNEQVALTSMHTVWVREHNRVEHILHELNPHWSGERLFQETRRIVIAEVQHIVLNEHLPLLFGPRIIKEYGLELQDYGYYDGYDPEIDPRVANEFSAAAFRFGHTLIQDRFRRTSHNFRPDDSLMLSTAFRRPPPIYEVRHGPGIDLLIRGLTDFPAQSYDRFFTKQITVSLFSERPPFGPGMDLLSLNIQRARDHGLQPYNAYREFCGLKRAYDFEDLYKEIPSREAINLLRKVYKSVDDIDLFTGGVYEDSVEGGVVGPTFACIIANQFRSARKGDRFFYENDHKFGFSPDQLQEIRRGTRLARVLCANSDDIDHIQPYALLHPFKEAYPELDNIVYDAGETGGMPYNSFMKHHGRDFNRRVSCRSLPDIDFSKWKEKPPPNYFK